MTQDFFSTLQDDLRNQGIEFPDAYQDLLRSRINKAMSYRPRIGILGKTGVGKSTLCNALFGQDVTLVSDVVAGTRSAGEIPLNAGSGGLTLVDLPGLGESQERDKEYGKMYHEMLPELDLVLWLIKADDRAISIDLAFYQKVVRPHLDQGKHLLVVITQSEKMEPMRDWDYQKHEPTATQLQNLQHKQAKLAEDFELSLQQVLFISSHERYHMVELLSTMIHSLPKERKITLLREAEPEFISDESREEASRGFWDYLLDLAKESIPFVAPKLIEVGYNVVRKLISIFL